MFLLFSRDWLFATPWSIAHQDSLSFTSSRSLFKLSQWWHPTISSSVIPFSSCLQSFPASGSFPTIVICQHTKILHNYWLYSPHCTFQSHESFILQLKISTSVSHTHFSALMTLFSSVCSLYLWLCFCLVMFVLLFFSEIIQYLSFSVWPISLSIILSKSIHVVTDGRFYSFYG